MRTHMILTRWIAVVTLGFGAAACGDQSPTGVELQPSADVSAAVVPAVASVKVYPGTFTLKVTQVKQLVAIPMSATGATLSTSGRVVTWSSSDLSVATVSATGVVKAVGAGKATITSTIDGTSGSSVITVYAPITVASVSVLPGTGSVAVGSYLSFMATPKDVNGNPVSGYTTTWKSSNTAVATVASNGTVKGLSAGTVTITATAGGQTGRATLTVTAPTTSTTTTTSTTSGIASVIVYPGLASLTTGQVKQFIALAYDAAGNSVSQAGRTITWTSSNAAVASVSSTGVAAAVTPGTTQITVDISGVKGTATLSVAAPF
jgi:trimeric autotransporter adhesin